MSPAEVAKQGTDAVSSVPGIAPWLQSAFGSLLFIVVSLSAFLAWARPAWLKAVSSWKQGDQGQVTQPTPVGAQLSNPGSAMIATEWNPDLLKVLPETVKRIENHIEYQNRALDDLVEAQNRTTEASNRESQASDRITQAMDRNSNAMDRLCRIIEDSVRLRERQGG